VRVCVCVCVRCIHILLQCVSLRCSLITLCSCTHHLPFTALCSCSTHRCTVFVHSACGRRQAGAAGGLGGVPLLPFCMHPSAVHAHLAGGVALPDVQRGGEAGMQQGVGCRARAITAGAMQRFT